MCLPGAPSMSQAECFCAPFPDEETEPGKSLMHYPADPETGYASKSKSALWKEAGKLIPDEV